MSRSPYKVLNIEAWNINTISYNALWTNFQ